MRIEPLNFKTFDAGAVATREGGKTFLPGGRRRSEGPPLPPPTYNHEQFKAAERESYKKGFLEGVEDGRKQQDNDQAATERKLLEAIGGLANAAAPLFAHYRATMEQMRQDMPKAALAIARKAAGGALDQNAQAAVEETVMKCIEMMIDEPKLMITVHVSLAEAMKKKVEQLTATLPAGKDISVMADESLPAADCRVEWKNGAFTRDTGKLWQEITRVVEGMSASAHHDAKAQMDTLQQQLPATDETNNGKKE